ncbi:calmodulin-dependent protein kinase [Gigaspora margarita]|uniref:Calmodulin-dependent protein kinase n=1 Tax=Gigaspora margarita TaxID=4874 RepID=A0A8H3XB00_GIGMA|nr:calmodulin-dependent protein kinase [Gigaspora margarita]
MSNHNNLFVKQVEKIECSSDITQIANNGTQLYLEDNNLQLFFKKLSEINYGNILIKSTGYVIVDEMDVPVSSNSENIQILRCDFHQWTNQTVTRKDNCSDYIIPEVVSFGEVLVTYSMSTIFDKLEQFLIKKKQNPENIINFSLDNPINSSVQFILASCYCFEKWVEKDKRKAFNSYQKLAEMDDSYRIFSVGLCYKNGVGVEKDEHKALIYYQKSAKMGEVNGIHNAGYCYLYGVGVKRDEHKHSFIFKNLQR